MTNPTGKINDTLIACPECGKPIKKTVQGAYNDLYGGYRIDLYAFAEHIGRAIKALEVNRKRHPFLYDGQVIEDRDIGGDAVADWLGYELEDFVAAVRHRQEEEAAEDEASAAAHGPLSEKASQ